MGVTWLFLRYFLMSVGHLSPILALLALLIAGGGWLLSRWNDMPPKTAVYMAFITALTIGYGDFTPKTPRGRVLCVVLGIIGLVFSGILVAGSVYAAERALREFHQIG